MDNPNTYDERNYLRAEQNLDDSVREMWEAGASKDDIRKSFEDLIEGNRGDVFE